MQKEWKKRREIFVAERASETKVRFSLSEGEGIGKEEEASGSYVNDS